MFRLLALILAFAVAERMLKPANAMPTIEENVNCWNKDYDWKEQGEEWSAPWGGSESQWWGTILPRIHAFVPCEAILEIAPGFGRWTQFLKDLTQKMTLVDLSARCINSCQRRFASTPHLQYLVNDGKSLDKVPNQSVDFIFSFDSLVHAEADVLESYVEQCAQKLTPNGVGFIHHSNASRYGLYFGLTKRLPRGRRFLAEKRIIINDCARALSMSSVLFEQFCAQAGLQCISQEIINWHGNALIDCISVFTKKGSVWSRPNRIVENRGFVREARNLERVSKLYSGFPTTPTER
jgi:SAM-dependent methyltransferase